MPHKAIPPYAVTLVFLLCAAHIAGCSKDSASPEAEPPQCSLSVDALDFGTVAIGSSADLSLVVRNSGGGVLEGAAEIACDGFEVVGASSYAIGAGESETLRLRFTPADVRPYECELSVAGCSSITLAGEGDLAPECSVEPDTLDFRFIEVGAFEEQEFLVRNIGGGTLSVSIQEECPDFEVVDARSESLGADESTTFTIRFTPSIGGDANCVVALSPNCQDVICTGVGLVPPLCVADALDLDFGTVTVGETADRTFRLRNAGGGILVGQVSLEACSGFEVLAPTEYSLGEGEEHEVIVRFSPLVSGEARCVLDPGQECEGVEITGVGELPPSCAVQPESIDFGLVVVGEFADRTFTLTNSGGGVLTGMIQLACPGFEILGDTNYSLSAGASSDFTIRYAPQSPGPVECGMNLGDTCGSLATIGSAELPPACSVSPMTLDLGPITVGTPVEGTVSVTNVGGGVLTGTLSEDCADLSVIGDVAYSLSSGETAEIRVRLVASEAGSQSCELILENCRGVEVRATAELAPVCRVDPPNLSFGSVRLGEDAEQVFVVENVGGGRLVGDLMSACPEFDPNESSFDLGAGEQKEFRVVFRPQVEGHAECDLDLGTDCDAIACSGEGFLEPQCAISPQSIDFGLVTLGEEAEEVVIITNEGGGMLVVAASEDCTDYDVVGQDGFELTSGQADSIVIRFRPTEEDVTSCTVDLGGACRSLELTGVGSPPPECAVTPSGLDFGVVTVGDYEDRQFTIENTGGGVLTGEISEDCAEFQILEGGTYSLSGGESASVTVRFAPTTAGNKNCSLDLGSDCGILLCEAEAEAAPVCSVTPTSLSFGDLTIGESATETFTIRNIGGGRLTGEVEEACGDYTIVGSAEYDLMAGQQQSISVRYAPSNVGADNCTISVGSGCSAVSCSGSGDYEPECVVAPTTLDFGTVTVGYSEDRNFQITNTGGRVLTGSVSESCPDFSIVGATSYSLSAGQSRTFVVRYMPQDSGSDGCTITASSGCASVGCSGYGEYPPECEVEPAFLVLDPVLIGESADTTFTIRNVGGGVLEGTIYFSCAEFALVGSGGFSLSSGQSKVFTIRYTPTDEDPDTCEMYLGAGCTPMVAAGVGYYIRETVKLRIYVTQTGLWYETNWPGWLSPGLSFSVSGGAYYLDYPEWSSCGPLLMLAPSLSNIRMNFYDCVGCPGLSISPDTWQVNVSARIDISDDTGFRTVESEINQCSSSMGLITESCLYRSASHGSYCWDSDQRDAVAIDYTDFSAVPVGISEWEYQFLGWTVPVIPGLVHEPRRLVPMDEESGPSEGREQE